MREFKGDTKRAIAVYKERQAIINKFAATNQMDVFTAKEILKANGYNAQLFD